MQLLNKIQQIKDQDIDSDLLIALDEARAVKDAVFNRANKMASEGKEYEGIEYSGTFMSRFVDMLIIAEWMRRKGYAPEEIAKIGKVQKGPLTKVLTHNDYEELKRLGMMDEYTSTKTLKVKR